jgi:lipoyl(octanoyl) transferase
VLEIQTIGLAPDYVPYLDGWALQRSIHAEVVDGTRRDTLLLLEHEPVYTLGRRSDASDLPMGEDWCRAQGIDVVKTQRGGKLTYHGPGQLVGYPIVRLPDHVFVVDYVRRLEEALIATCSEFGVTRPGDALDSSSRHPGLVGFRVTTYRAPRRRSAANRQHQ